MQLFLGVLGYAGIDGSARSGTRCENLVKISKTLGKPDGGLEIRFRALKTKLQKRESENSPFKVEVEE